MQRFCSSLPRFLESGNPQEDNMGWVEKRISSLSRNGRSQQWKSQGRNLKPHLSLKYSFQIFLLWFIKNNISFYLQFHRKGRKKVSFPQWNYPTCQFKGDMSLINYMYHLSLLPHLALKYFQKIPPWIWTFLLWNSWSGISQYSRRLEF